MLRNRGYDVRAVADGADALCEIRRAAPSLVLLDLVLPGAIDGWMVLHEMRSDPPLAAVPVCVVSAIPERLPHGTPFLRKPTSFTDILSVVEQFCGPSKHVRSPRG